MTTTTLHDQIKQLIISRLNLRIKAEEIPDTAPLFAAEDGGLGLDSIDALDLAVGLFEEFQVEVSQNDMHIFANVDSMAAFLESKLGVSEVAGVN